METSRKAVVVQPVAKESRSGQHHVPGQSVPVADTTGKGMQRASTMPSPMLPTGSQRDPWVDWTTDAF